MSLQRLPPPPGRSRARVRFLSMPFLDDKLMSGPPSLDQVAFKQPRLRKCPFDPATISWENAQRLGGGADGYVWKVYFGDQGPYAIKVFYDTSPPEFNGYYAAQRECQNSALLQMIAAAVDEVKAGQSGPIMIDPNPKTKADAIDNLYSFSTEARRYYQQLSPVPPELVQFDSDSVPRLRQCYGWTKVDGRVFRQIPRAHMPRTQVIGHKLVRHFSSQETYTAIVYEYVEESENDHAVVEAVSRFHWLVGFRCAGSPMAKNWKSGVLIDLSDIVNPLGHVWVASWYGPCPAEMILRK